LEMKELGAASAVAKRARAAASCTPSPDGSRLECPDAHLPNCTGAQSCTLGLSLMAWDSDPASEVRQSLALTVHAVPKILALSP